MLSPGICAAPASTSGRASACGSAIAGDALGSPGCARSSSRSAGARSMLPSVLLPQDMQCASPLAVATASATQRGATTLGGFAALCTSASECGTFEHMHQSIPSFDLRSIEQSASIAAQAEIAAASHTADAETLLQDLNMHASIAEEAQMQLALAKLSLEEAQSVGDSSAESHDASQAQAAASAAAVQSWQGIWDGAKAALQKVHHRAAGARQKAQQTHQHAAQQMSGVQAALCTALSFEIPAPTGDAAAQIAQRMHAQVVETLVAEQAACESEAQAALHRADTAREEAAAALAEAEIAADHGQQCRQGGKAADAAASESAARILMHRSKAAHAREQAARGDMASARARQEQLQELARRFEDQGAQEGSNLVSAPHDGDVASTGPEQQQTCSDVELAARIASLQAEAAHSTSAALDAAAVEMQEQLDQLERKGDTYAADRLRASLQVLQVQSAKAAETRREVQRDAAIAQQSAAAAQLSHLQSAERRQATDAAEQALLHSQLSTVASTHGCIASLLEAASSARRSSQQVCEHRLAQLQSQACVHEQSAAASMVTEDFTGARSAQEAAQRTQVDLAEVRFAHVLVHIFRRLMLASSTRKPVA